MATYRVVATDKDGREISRLFGEHFDLAVHEFSSLVRDQGPESVELVDQDDVTFAFFRKPE